MGKQKSKSPNPVSGGEVNGNASAKASRAKEEVDEKRPMRRLKKGTDIKDSGVEARRRADDVAVKEGFGVFQYKDDEEPASAKKSHGKFEDQKITNFVDKSGKSSRKEKADIKAAEKSKLEEKRKARKKRHQDSDDEWDLGAVNLDEEDNDPGDIDDSDEELIRQITNKQKQMKGRETLNGDNQGSNSRTRGRETNSKGMDIEEVEMVRGQKDGSTKARGRNSIHGIDLEKNKREASASKEPPSTKKGKKPSTIKDSTMEDENEITGPLSGMNIVLTGLFTCVGGDNKESLVEVIKILGGRSAGSVSGKTSLLVAGYQLPDGRETSESSKYKAAKAKKVKIMTEAEFQEMMMKHTGMTLLELIDGGAKACAKKDFKAAADTRAANQTAGNLMDIESEGGKTITHNGNTKSFAAKRGNMMDEENNRDSKINSTSLWTEKYAPKRASDIIGNRGVIEKLKEWILNWEDVVINGNKKEVKWKGGFGGNPSLDNPNARAALVSGSPGIGKTSAVRLLCKELGFNLIEQNASDIRNKKAVQGTLSILGSSMSLTASGDIANSIILMDEVDGMSSDRGGTAALNEYIKKTRVPIICVCNDRSHPKMRTLAGNCYDLKFSKPPRPIIVERIKEIVKGEGMMADENSLDKLVEQMNGDIRQILGFLQVWSKRPDNNFIYATFSKDIEKFKKDQAVTVSNFDAATILLNKAQRGSRTYKDLLSLYFIDYDLVPLLVQENYLNSASKTTDLNQLRRVAKAADSIARSDMTNLLVRRDQNWKLLDAVGFTSSVLPCYLVAEFCGFAKFPEFFGKFSSGKKMQREIKELKMAMMEHVSGNGDAIKFDYAPALFNLLKVQMVKSDEESFGRAMEIYENYGLTPELVKEHLVDLIYNPSKKDLMEGIETKSKASFTRLYNSKFKESLVHKKKKRAAAEEELEGMEGLDDAKTASNPEDEEDEEDSVEVLLPAKGTKKAVKSKAGDKVDAKKSKKSKK